MKKACLLLLVLSLAGCGGSGSPTNIHALAIMSIAPPDGTVGARWEHPMLPEHSCNWWKTDDVWDL